MATNAQGYRLAQYRKQRGEPLNTMKIALSIVLGINACIGLLILVLNHQLP